MIGAAPDDVFDTVLDPGVGIVGLLDERSVDANAPDYVHCRARLCDPSVLGGVATPRLIETAAADREVAMIAAVHTGVSRYCAALYDRASLPMASAIDAAFPCLRPADFALYSKQQYAAPGFPYVPFDETTPVRWTGAVDLATGEATHVPAAMVWYPFAYERAAGDSPIAVSAPVGLGCGAGVAAAAFAGIGDVVACDAAALFWQAMILPPRLRLDTLPSRPKDRLDRFAQAGEVVTILDVTTDNRIPAFVAFIASSRPERAAYVFAVAADLDAGRAVETVLDRLAANHRLAGAIVRGRARPSATNDWEDVLVAADHVNFAADHDNRARFAWLTIDDEQRDLRDYDQPGSGDVEGDLEVVLDRIMAAGHRVYAANLTSEDVAGLGINVCRVIVPGYQPLLHGHRLRVLGGDRLYDAPRRLGHRGITREGGGNPAPHPFA